MTTHQFAKELLSKQDLPVFVEHPSNPELPCPAPILQLFTGEDENDEPITGYLITHEPI